MDTKSDSTNGHIRSVENPSKIKAISDNPIRSSTDDSLGRLTSAKSFAQNVLSLDASEGIVVGVLGAWGSGKTSFINLAREEFLANGVPVLDFNPWMFSGAEQLVESFFSEISAQLKISSGLEDIGRAFSEYGEIFSGLSWLPIVGPWMERGEDIAKIFGDILQRKNAGISGIRKRVEDALSRLDTPVVIVLDDIDRLGTDEIRDLFKLVRLTANFPNIIYVVSFDRSRVESALSEQGISGRAYLEKIIQLGIDLPAIPFKVLNKEIFSALDSVLSSIENIAVLDQGAWPDIFMEIIRPQIASMRDVRRFSLAVRGTVRDLNGQVALVDILGLEAVRVFLPDVFHHLHSAVEALTSTSGSDYNDPQASLRLKAKVDQLVELAGDRSEIVNALVERLFPAAQRHIGGTTYGADWKNGCLRNRRVAHENILHLYLERVVGEELHAFMGAETAWTLMSDSDALNTFLCGIVPAELQDVISSLEAYEEKFTPAHVVPASIVLLNLVPNIPSRERGMFELGAQMVVGRVVYRLIRSLKDQALVEASVREIMLSLTTLSSKMQLIAMVGYKDGVGHKLVSEAVATELEENWRLEVCSSSVEVLSAETDLLRVFLVAQNGSDVAKPSPEVPDSPNVTLALLKSARSDAKSQSFGSRAVKKLPRLAWKALSDIYGGASILNQRVHDLISTAPKDSEDLLALAEKYGNGWQPDDDRD